jgi:hypothetical protein
LKNDQERSQIKLLSAPCNGFSYIASSIPLAQTLKSLNLLDLLKRSADRGESRESRPGVQFGALFFKAANAQHPAQQCLLMRALERA